MAVAEAAAAEAVAAEQAEAEQTGAAAEAGPAPVSARRRRARRVAGSRPCDAGTRAGRCAPGGAGAVVTLVTPAGRW